MTLTAQAAPVAPAIAPTLNSIIGNIIQGMRADLKTGLDEGVIQSYYASQLLHHFSQLLHHFDVMLKSDIALIRSSLKTPPIQAPKAKNDIESFIKGMTTTQITEELYKLCQQYSTSSIGKLIGIPASGAYSMLRAWTTGKYSPNEDNEEAIRALVLGWYRKDAALMSKLTPPGKRPKGF